MTCTRNVFAALALTLVASFAAAQGPNPCAEDERYAQLDFWVGEWQVFDAEGNPVGTNRIEKILAGCLIQETWSSAGSGSGRSMNFFDPALGRWRQVWVDQQGGVVRYEGALRGSAMQFVGESIGADGGRVVARAVLEPLADGRLRHFIEHSSDAGSTWVTYFDGTYQRLGEAMAQADTPAVIVPGSPSAPRAPLPETEGVRPVSTVVPENQLPVGERNKVHLSSPMTLEVDVGPLNAIREGYSWRTDETGVYLCDGVAIRDVTLTKKKRRGKVEIGVRLTLHSENFSRRVDVLTELVTPGGAVGSTEFKGVKLGNAIPLHDPKDGLQTDAVMTVDADTFEEIFSADEPPKLRMTLTIR